MNAETSKGDKYAKNKKRGRGGILFSPPALDHYILYSSNRWPFIHSNKTKNTDQISQDTSIFIQMAVYYFIITNVRYGTTTSDTTCTRINNDCSGWTTWLYRYKIKKKNQEVPGRVWKPIIHPSFLPFSKILLNWQIWTKERETPQNLPACVGGHPKARLE